MEVVSSNLATPTAGTPEKSGVLFLSAPKKKVSAPSIYEIEFSADHDFGFEAEGPNHSTQIEMLEFKLCDYNGDISKRWYVEFYAPDRKRVYGRVNVSKDPVQRKYLLIKLSEKLSQQYNLKKNNDPVISFPVADKDNITFHMNAYIQAKREVLAKDSIKNITGSLVYFHEYLKRHQLTLVRPSEIKKNNISLFLQELPSHLSNRSKKNHLEFICSFFNYLINNYEDVLLKNPCHGIDKIKTKSEKNIAYSRKLANAIIAHLKEKRDFNTLNFCRFVGIGFIRPKEARMLKIGDIDFDRRTITLPAKNAKVTERTVKPLLDVFFKYLLEMNLQGYPPDYYVFTVSGVPGPKGAYQNCFQKRFKKVKDVFGLSKNHSLYGFRHSVVCDLLKSKAAWTEIMKYTGHETFDAFQEYAKSLMDEPAEDLSAGVLINF